MKLVVMVKGNYGRELMYPVNDTAKLFAKLLKQKSFLMENLKVIKELGYQIEVKSAYELGDI